MITDSFMITEKSNLLQVIMITDYNYPMSVYVPGNNFGQGWPVSSPNHIFPWASLNKWLISTYFRHISTYFRLYLAMCD